MLSIDLAILSFFSAVLSPVKPLKEQKKGASPRKISVERILGAVIGTSLATFFYWVDPGENRVVDVLPHPSLIFLFFWIALAVGYLSEVIVYRALNLLQDTSGK